LIRFVPGSKEDGRFTAFTEVALANLYSFGTPVRVH